MTKLAYVNDYQEAKRFFDEFNIPYEVITEGESKGRLLVNEIKPEGRSWLLAAEDRLRKSRLSVICDHSNEFLDRDGNVIITFSPYNISELPPHRPWLKMSDHSIYGHGTKTFVVLSSELEKEAEQKRQKKRLGTENWRSRRKSPSNQTRAGCRCRKTQRPPGRKGQAQKRYRWW